MLAAVRTLALLLLLAGATAGADEPAAPAPVRRVQGPEQGADEVLRALAAGDQEALVRLARGSVPDPWYVAELLRIRGEREAAQALAAAADDLAPLRVYLAAREPHPDDVAAVQAIGPAYSMLGSDAGATLTITEPYAGKHESVVLLGLAHARAIALSRLERREEALSSFELAGRGAQEIGWWAQAMRSLGGALQHASLLQQPSREFDAAGRLVEVARKAGVAAEEIDGLRALGTLHRHALRLAEALAAHRAALALAEDLAQPRPLVATLIDLAASLSRSGENAQALALAQRALELSEQPDAASLRFFALSQVGEILADVGELEQASRHQSRALELAEQEKSPGRIARALTAVGDVLVESGDVQEALPHLERALEMGRAQRDAAREASVLSRLGRAHKALGRPAQAIQAYEEVFAIHQRLGRSVAGVLGDLAISYRTAGEYGKAREYHQREMELKEASGDRTGLATGLANLCLLYQTTGDLVRAQTYGEQALALHEALGDQQAVGRTLVNLGSVHKDLGDLSRALSCFERARAIQERIGDRGNMAAALGNMGVAHSLLGDPDRARGHFERALAIYRELRNERGIAHYVGALGNHLVGVGEPEQALPYLDEALVTHDEARSPSVHASLLLTRAGALAALGRVTEALAVAERGLAVERRLGNPGKEAEALVGVGRLRARLDRRDEALKDLEAAVRLARRARQPRPQIDALTSLAGLHLKAGQDAQALARAREALTPLEESLGGLGEEEGALARQEHATLYALGVLAAARQQDAAEALTFLESGRAGALLESLGGRQALRWARVPEDVREAEASARAQLALARQAMDLIDETRAEATPEQRAQARRALDQATERLRTAVARSQREAKQAAGLRYPRAATIEEIRGSLRAGQALVLYALAENEALALVLEPDAERIVELGERATLETLCAELDCTNPDVKSAPVLASLRERLLVPLGLSDSVRQVIVSPEGALCYLPFGALVDRPVALTPSGTTHALLGAELRSVGEGVLALGDPDYAGISEHARALFHRGRKLTPLPATRAEVAAVGTVRLLGAEATEAALRQHLSERRSWRALHLACHGLIDPLRPTLSSLALTRSGDDDGFLTAAEVLRLEIRAGLVALSACQTATGRVVSGEGVVGLTRAFMYAGAPRVLCSLWKVDDAATAALMTKFYELWLGSSAPVPPGTPPSPPKGLPAAEALREAQSFIRAQAPWSHPYYWAAWVLWGLPS